MEYIDFLKKYPSIEGCIKYSNEKILHDDSSSKYMDIIKLKGYIHWLEFFSKNRPLNLVTN